MPWISLEDEVRALIFALGDDELAGPVNLTGPAPVTNAEFTACAGPGRQPADADAGARHRTAAVVGEFASEGLLAGQRPFPPRWRTPVHVPPQHHWRGAAVRDGTVMSTSVRSGAGPIDVQRLGLVDYRAAWDRQRNWPMRDWPVARTPCCCSNTAGVHRRAAHRSHERPADGVPVVDTDRGGKITWHGPGSGRLPDHPAGRTAGW